MAGSGCWIDGMAWSLDWPGRIHHKHAITMIQAQARMKSAKDVVGVVGVVVAQQGGYG